MFASPKISSSGQKDFKAPYSMSANSDIGLMALTVSPRGIGRSGLQGLLESASRSAWSSHLLVLLHHRGRH